MVPLPHSFYDKSALQVAPALLGCLVVADLRGRRVAGKIVETEAYLGHSDAASHAYRGPTRRSEVMFGPAGYAYIYLIYGIHNCLNVVTGPEGRGQAVLIRALEPLEGLDIMAGRRHKTSVNDLCNGPGKLCQALAIDRSLNGHDLSLEMGLWFESGAPVAESILVGSRIGVRGDDAALSAPRRFFLQDNRFVSPAPQNRQAAPLVSSGRGTAQ